MNTLIALLALFIVGDIGEKSPEQIFKESDYVVYLEIGSLGHRKEEDGTIIHYPRWGKCSGFLHKDNDGIWVLSAGHCVPEYVDHLYGPHVAYFRSSLKKVPEEIEFFSYDPTFDCSLFRVKNQAALKDFLFPTLGSSKNLVVGQQVIALGNPFPTRFTQTVGWAVNSSFVGFAINAKQPQLITHSAIINPGSSGGPLVNLKGEIIGINVMVFTPPTSGPTTAFGLAVPIDDIKFLLTKLKRGGRVEHQSMGSISFANSYNLHESDLGGLSVPLNDSGRPAKEGLIVIGIKPDTQTALSSLQVGDLVISCNGQEPEDLIDLFKMIYLKADPFEILKMEVERDGKKIILPLLLVDTSEKTEKSDMENSPSN